MSRARILDGNSGDTSADFEESGKTVVDTTAVQMGLGAADIAEQGIQELVTEDANKRANESDKPSFLSKFRLG